MASQVIKKDGSKQPFDPEKIKDSIRAAALQAGLPEEKINEVAGQVTLAAVSMADAKEEITSSEIKEKILSELDSIEPSVSESWRKYDAEKKGA